MYALNGHAGQHAAQPGKVSARAHGNCCRCSRVDDQCVSCMVSVLPWMSYVPASAAAAPSCQAFLPLVLQSQRFAVPASPARPAASSPATPRRPSSSKQWCNHASHAPHEEALAVQVRHMGLPVPSIPSRSAEARIDKAAVVQTQGST